MTSFQIRQGLPFVSVSLRANGKSLTLTDILVDTGSAATAFRTDALKPLGITPQPDDPIRVMVGIGGGTEAVIERPIDALEIGELRASPFPIQIGLLDYQIQMNGIIGTDFLLASKAVLDFSTRSIHPLK
ncbi:MAG: retropepsin-like domain-containing protein [Anaerolineales bacterium]|nr:retropepsin-like domain-containing protein [Anaerolineales bacterium]